jgi:hypothetical protein
MINKEQAYAYLKAVWPTIYRIINGGLYFLFTLIREFCRLAMQEIKGKQ